MTLTAILPPEPKDWTQVACATPECREKAGHGVWQRFCEPHADNLARIREMYETDTKPFKISKTLFRAANSVDHRFAGEALDQMMTGLLDAA